MGILSGLENLGVKISEDDIYADNKQKQQPKQAQEPGKAQAGGEGDYLIAKSFTCPVCGTDFKSLIVKAGRVRFIGSDVDLRPRYEQLDTLKYGAVMCPFCGYAGLAKNFSEVTDVQRKNIREQISKNFHADASDGVTYSYDEAIKQYQMVLANAIVKKAKSSDKAYICLMMAWVVRGKAEELKRTDPANTEAVKECRADEKELLKNALEGFCAARGSEDFPMCGMDENTIDYLIAALYYESGEYDKCLRMLSELIASRTAGTKIKDKARDLKDIVMAARRK